MTAHSHCVYQLTTRHTGEDMDVILRGMAEKPTVDKAMSETVA